MLDEAHCARNIGLWILRQSHKNWNYRDEKEAESQENTKKCHKYTQNIGDFPMFEFHNKRSEQECEETRNQK